MSNKRQAAALSTVLDLDHVLVVIVQCVPAAEDVKALLAVLPASARSIALAARHELLQAAQHHVLPTEPKPLGALWPLLRLDVITSAATGLLAARLSDLDAVEWLRLWSAKITHYKQVENDALFNYPDLCDVLRECTNLVAVDVREATEAEEIMEAVTTPAHRVRSISVDCYIFEFDFATLDRWLSSGHAEHLAFSFFATEDEVNPAFVPMLLKTTALSSLELVSLGSGSLRRSLPSRPHSLV
ncbi:hypothetical protein SDRG_01722 [Saprolegnia diclina VS20]|uniref:F-box domain-containing protein n=1 Tax=Saprolegnia diclina (strain VS20) TaxID=1156394 RepID=T0R109_SAPDV|nr:hypothetical protein SDRG_01722 [Saprolegnia diclina VS20]EQC40641.1 hypothetical protein SDRG_01722 [Saprolegnia diclina VS20]|eukprot:XP_008605485.1 hypothetical protein SDRG_01722 [Saprolegnia diclina VS20]